MRTRLYSLDELDDIPGTKVFTAMRSRQAYHLHKFCMSLMDVYCLVKLSNTDGGSTQQAVGSMTGMTRDEYAAMMRAGGRSIEGNRSIKGKN